MLWLIMDNRCPIGRTDFQLVDHVTLSGDGFGPFPGAYGHWHDRGCDKLGVGEYAEANLPVIDVNPGAMPTVTNNEVGQCQL